VAKEENPRRKDEGQASGEEQLRGDEDLFVGAAVEGEPVPGSARENGVSGTPVLFWAE
jgi:hypothetical protein